MRNGPTCDSVYVNNFRPFVFIAFHSRPSENRHFLGANESCSLALPDYTMADPIHTNISRKITLR